MNYSVLRTRVFTALAVLLFSAFLFSDTSAQSGTSGVRGTVSDQNGAAVPGATVRLTNPATGFERTSTTSDDGNYNFPGIPPATYQLEVEAANFKRLVNSNVQALVDLTNEVNLTLEPGAVTVTVDVTSNTIESVVNTQDATIGNNFSPEQITNLPTNLRRVADLLNLQPGVTREGYVAGGRADQSNVTLDGIDINDQQNGGRDAVLSENPENQTSQETVLRITAESVEEFRITTTGANANQGRSSGAQISLITKSGTNNFRGAAFYFYRPTAFSSNTFFNNLAGVERGSLARDLFGGAIGGPIVKDKLFFFYSYEGQREQFGESSVNTVPLAHVGQGQIRFSGTGPSCDAEENCVVGLAELNNIIYPQVGINPLAMAALANAASRYPSNDSSVGDGINTGGFRFNSPRTIDEDTHIAKFDYILNEKHSFFLRGNYQNDLSTFASAFPDTPQTALWSHPYGFVIGHNWSVNNNMVNNFRYGLTRQAFTQLGDSSDNAITFRFVFSPLLFTRDLSRVTPVQNFTNDFTWIKGGHTIQLGGNVRIIRNKRLSFANAFDDAVTNPSFYDFSGAVVTDQFTAAGYDIDDGNISTVQAAATALIGRFSQYSGNFTFDIDGNPLDVGTPSARNFATEEYDIYGQDIWKPFKNLTLTMGLRYALSRPVYEKDGFQIVPSERLGDFFDRRVASSAQGVPLNDSIQFQLGGPVNNAPGFYSMDWNNWQPRIAAAWSPDFKSGFLKTLFGEYGKSVIRGGFGITNDQFGGQLAVSFDGLSSIGFTSSTTIAANTYNVTDNPAPLFTMFGQNVRDDLPGIPPPALRFDTPADQAQRIESSLDATIKSPTHYVWNVSYGRQLPKGMYFEASYIGRKARNLFAARDIMALNNLVDPATGMDWYTAAGMLHDARLADVPILSLPAIPYFENLFPNAMAALGVFGLPANNNTQAIYGLAAREGFSIADWTFIQLIIDDAFSQDLPVNPGLYPNMFFHPQYAAFSSFGTTAKSDYHGGTFTLRQRLGDTLSFDLNYTFSKSFDNASGLSTGASYGSQFILNALRPDDNYTVSDFDVRHGINGNFIFKLPVGRGKALFGDMGRLADAVFGGWQLNGIFRWNSGRPFSVPFDAEIWATNWNAQSAGTRIQPVTFGAVRSTQNAFSDPQAALNAFRNARPGETGERNAFRLPGYSTIDLGLTKSWGMPWNENHKFQFRIEVFNLANKQYFLANNFTRSSYGLPVDPDLCTPENDCEVAPDFGKIYTDTKGPQQGRRFFQFGFRYSF